VNTPEVKAGKHYAAEQAQKKRRASLRCAFDGKMNAWQKCLMKFLIGGVGYGLIELIWRGRTHFSMVITGGACLVAICAVNEKMRERHVFLRAAVCAAAITAAEFAVGMLVNRALGMGVWDYSGMAGNILGQICPLYSFLWFLLCVPICSFVGRIGVGMNNE
jgi:hypothetical protein